MKRAGRLTGILGRGVLTALLGSFGGCMCYLHPVDKPKPSHFEPCREIPKCARDHVYIFMIHGLDPFNYANLNGVRDYIQCLGFHKTYYGQLYHICSFEEEM